MKKSWLGILGLVLKGRSMKSDRPKKIEMTIELGYASGPPQEPVKYESPQNAACPYCGYKYPHMPKRSQKCPECKKYIYRVKNSESRTYQLITEEQHQKEIEQAARDNQANAAKYARSTLNRYRDSGIKRVKISTSGEESCPSCRNQSRRTYLIEDALKEMPIPCRSCTFDLHGEHASIGWCRCVYIADLSE